MSLLFKNHSVVFLTPSSNEVKLLNPYLFILFMLINLFLSPLGTSVNHLTSISFPECLITNSTSSLIELPSPDPKLTGSVFLLQHLQHE